MMKTVVIVLAAGQGKRMNSDLAKQYLLIQDRPVLYYSLKTFEDSFVDAVILVVGAGEQDYCRNEIVEKYQFHKVNQIIEGGKERYHSVYNGLMCANGYKYVFIHDGARPFVDEAMLKRAYAAVTDKKACVVGMPVKDTIKIADENEFAVETPPRDLVWMIQTPQVFETDLIIEAYKKLMDNEEEILKQGIKITDDAMVVETFMKKYVKLVKGSYENIKITTPEDLIIAESLVKRRSL